MSPREGAPSREGDDADLLMGLRVVAVGTAFEAKTDPGFDFRQVHHQHRAATRHPQQE
jgi:hypothetical protein